MLSSRSLFLSRVIYCNPANLFWHSYDWLVNDKILSVNVRFSLRILVKLELFPSRFYILDYISWLDEIQFYRSFLALFKSMVNWLIVAWDYLSLLYISSLSRLISVVYWIFWLN